MTRILVTGGAGFIGSHLVTRLISEPNKITVIDNLSRGSLSNLPSISEVNMTIVNANVTDYEILREHIQKSDVVFHLAALSRVMPSIENPERCLNDNVLGTEVIARLCATYNKKLIFSSSREVYGTANYLPVDENHPQTPENPYGASKICGENIILSYSHCYGLRYGIVRLTNVYGERDFDRVIPLFVKKAMNSEPLIVFGGSQIIDFVHVSDVTDLLVKISNHNSNIIVNAGSGNGITVLELAELVQKTVGNKTKIIVQEKRRGEVERFVANIGKAKQLLDWEPRVSLASGLMHLVKSLN